MANPVNVSSAESALRIYLSAKKRTSEDIAQFLSTNQYILNEKLEKIVHEHIVSHLNVNTTKPNTKSKPTHHRTPTHTELVNLEKENKELRGGTMSRRRTTILLTSEEANAARKSIIASATTSTVATSSTATTASATQPSLVRKESEIPVTVNILYNDDEANTVNNDDIPPPPPPEN